MKPRWAEEFEVWEFDDGDQLEFKVWDKDLVGSDYLGKVLLSPDAFMENGCNNLFQMEEAGKDIRAYLGLQIKVQGQKNYPSGPPSEFEVTVEKGDGSAEYGLDVDCQDLKNLHVCNVATGAIQKYNEGLDFSKQVINSDFIVSVNGGTDVSEMTKQFQTEKVTLKIIRAFDVSVLVEQFNYKTHGLTFPKKMQRNVLVVMDIGPGYIKDHNDSRHTADSDKIRVYDRIVSVKGQVGKAATLKRRLDRATGKFQLAIQRPCPHQAVSTAPGGMFYLW